MTSHVEVAVVGAGPAGMAAAICASNYGANVLLLDEHNRPGGQIYRSADCSPLNSVDVLGKDYRRGTELIDRLRQAPVTYLSEASVWNIDRDRNLSTLIEGKNLSFSADRVILCDGAQERPMPLPGWELPGVMTAGAAQILLKSSAMVPRERVLLAGTGPLLLLLAWQYLQAGISITGLLDTAPRDNIRRCLRFLPKSLFALEYFAKAYQMHKAIRRAGVPVYKHVNSIRACGQNDLDTVRFNSNSVFHEIEAELLFLHQGVIPNLHSALAAGCDLKWSHEQLCWQVEADPWGGTSCEGIYVAGDNQAIGGATVAELRGKICALKVLHDLGYLSDRQMRRTALPVKISLARHIAVRPLIDAVFRPADSYLIPQDQTIVCRCEEVTAGVIRQIARQNCQGPNQMKAFTRCGMGPCQGRQCGVTVAAIIADEQGRSIEQVGYYRVRPPLKPVSLGQVGSVD